MRLALLSAAALLAFPMSAHAQEPASLTGVVYRLPPAQIEAILDKKAEDRATKDAQSEFETRRLGKTGRVATGVLGFLGTAAADARYQDRCGLSGFECRGLTGSSAPILDVVR